LSGEHGASRQRQLPAEYYGNTLKEKDYQEACGEQHCRTGRSDEESPDSEAVPGRGSKSKRTDRRMIDRRLFTHFDWGLLALVLLIGGLGIINIASATILSHNRDGVLCEADVLDHCRNVAGGHILQHRLSPPGGFLLLALRSPGVHAACRVDCREKFHGRHPVAQSRFSQFSTLGTDENYHHNGLCQLFYKDAEPERSWIEGSPYPFLLMPSVLLIMKQPDLGTATLGLMASSMLMFVGYVLLLFP
jgi:hypothetical protein